MEKIDSIKYELLEEDKADETASSIPFDPSKISLQVRQPTIYNLMQRIQANPQEINMNTFFQRHNNLWSDADRARLIESMLLRIPLPAFYFDGSDDECWLIVDGLQRLTTFYEFIGTKKLKLKELEYLKEYNGKGFDELPRNMQRRIEETQITAYIIQPGTPENVKFNIFKRINTGGIPLSPQEIRFALHQGIASDFLDRLAIQDDFKKIIDVLKVNRMEPQELVLRFLTFYLLGYKSYEPDMDSFLNCGMDKLEKCTQEKFDLLEKKFAVSMQRNLLLFNDKSFRKLSKQNGKIRRGPLNKALFEIWSTSMANLDEKSFLVLYNKRKILFYDYLNFLKNNPEFIQSVSSGTSKKTAVTRRFEDLQCFIRKEIKNDSTNNDETI